MIWIFGIETTIDGDVLDKGCIALEANCFLRVIQKTPDSEVTIETDSNNKALIKCEKQNSTLPVKMVKILWLYLKSKKSFYYTFPVFIKRDHQTDNFSIADNESNRMMSGELLQIDQDQLRLYYLWTDRESLSVKLHLKNLMILLKQLFPEKH